MNLYSVTNNNFSQLKEKPFKLEQEIQRLFKDNLLQITGLQKVKSDNKINLEYLMSLIKQALV